MSKRLDRRLVTTVNLLRLYDIAGMNDLCELLNISDSHIYTTLKAGKCSPMLELAATAIMAEHYPVEVEINAFELWVVTVPRDKCDPLNSVLRAFDIKFQKIVSDSNEETPNG